MVQFRRTQGVALGVVSAACGVAVFLVATFLLFWIF